jgi:hypothetical protein
LSESALHANHLRRVERGYSERRYPCQAQQPLAESPPAKRGSGRVVRHNGVRTLAGLATISVMQSMFVVTAACHYCTCAAWPKVITISKRPNDECGEFSQLAPAHRLDGSANAMRIKPQPLDRRGLQVSGIPAAASGYDGGTHIVGAIDDGGSARVYAQASPHLEGDVGCCDAHLHTGGADGRGGRRLLARL